MFRRHLQRLLVAALTIGASPVSAADPPAKVDQLKAAYLFNFAKFVDWPGGPTRIVLCVRSGTTASELVQALDGRQIDELRTLEIRPVVSPSVSCHMYYSSGTYSDIGSTLQVSLQEQNDFPAHVLSVSDRQGALDRGYALEFFVDGKKLRFSVNQRLLEDADFKISSKLLNLARERR